MNVKRAVENQIDIFNMLKSNKEKNRLSHAYLFYGNEGSGKVEMAYALSCLLYCPNGGCLECETCKTILDSSHLNVNYIGLLNKKTMISKEQIEDLYSDLESNYDSREPSVYRGIFTGTIYLKQTGHVCGKYNNYSVIDGQQRLTTFTLMLLAIYCIAKERSTKDKNLCSTKQMLKIRDILWKESDDENQKEVRLLELGNLDKSLLIQIFDYVFSGTNKITEFLNSFENLRSNSEKLIIFIIWR